MVRVSLVGQGDNHQQGTYDCWNGEDLLLGVVEEPQYIVTDDDAGLAGENVLDTHFRILLEMMLYRDNCSV